MATAERSIEICGQVVNRRECRALLIPEEEGGFSVVCTSLPGVASQGETEIDAIANLREAFLGAIQSYQELGMEIPWGKDSLVERPANAKEIWIVVDA